MNIFGKSLSIFSFKWKKNEFYTGKMLFSNSSRADLSGEVNGPDHKVFIQYSLGNLSSFTHANAMYPNIKCMNLWIWLSGNSSCPTFISLCNKLLHPWLTITKWWMLMQSFSGCGMEWYCTAHFFLWNSPLAELKIN